MPMKNPPHPGAFIRTEIIAPAGLTVTAAAAALQVSRPALSSLLNGKADLSGEMALRIEKAFGVKMETLMRLQSAFDIVKTRSREKEIRVRRFHPRVEVHPYTRAEQITKGLTLRVGTRSNPPNAVSRERRALVELVVGVVLELIALAVPIEDARHFNSIAIRRI